jgi:L-amino acid N-acyltransferase YncA
LEGCDEGEIFLIKDNQKIIGITGYFPYEETYSDFFLRWHGLLPEYQKIGISQKVLDTMIKYLEKKYENFSTIKEFMPVRESYKKTEEYFIKIGFQKIGEPEKVEWSKDLWQTFEYRLPQKKLRNHV